MPRIANITDDVFHLHFFGLGEWLGREERVLSEEAAALLRDHPAFAEVAEPPAESRAPIHVRADFTAEARAVADLGGPAEEPPATPADKAPQATKPPKGTDGV